MFWYITIAIAVALGAAVYGLNLVTTPEERRARVLKQLFNLRVELNDNDKMKPIIVQAYRLIQNVELED